MYFNIPYYYPGWNPGYQITNLQQGGPSSHMSVRATQPEIWPLAYGVSTFGMGNGYGGAGMPRQVIGPTPVSVPGTPAIPPNASMLEIAGLMKNPASQG